MSCCGFHRSGECNAAAIGGPVAGAAAGSVLFAGAAGVLAQDNANFFWDNTNKRLGIGTTTPAVDLSVKPDTDGGAIIGRCRLSIGGTTDRAAFSHIDMTSGAQVALQQLASGQTLLNCATGTSVSVRHNAQERFVGDSTSSVVYGPGPVQRFKADGTGLGFFTATPVAQQTITGSRGGNAALADLLTKIALTGLIIDNTTP